jgi:2-oxoglutarate ferredoxin oxidoreductase subunit alpha
MNDWMIPELEWDDSYQPDRGKVLSADEIESLEKFYRYEDRDGDAIPYRTLPGTHPKGAYFTRGSGHNWKGGYTEDSDEYKEVLDRLTTKWKNAANAVPAPVITRCGQPARRAIISVGGCDGAVLEALDRFAENGVNLDYLRVRGFPFNAEVDRFIEQYDEVFVVEQNRDGQLRSLLVNETEAPKHKLVSILDYAGMAANPKFIIEGISAHLEALGDVA